MRQAEDHFQDIGVVFYKDGRNFFRPAQESQMPSQRKSLKNYTSEEISKMILVRSEEELLISKLSRATYYDPKEPIDKIKVYSFSPVKFNYSHLSKEELLTYQLSEAEPERVSKSLFICKGQKPLNGKLELRFRDLNESSLPKLPTYSKK